MRYQIITDIYEQRGNVYPTCTMRQEVSYPESTDTAVALAHGFGPITDGDLAGIHTRRLIAPNGQRRDSTITPIRHA